ncbi:hypothetical protein H2203_004344 [Taxawa tesnikishii (nom. ined.)]|nr:hypothetical protein H2203_004344 [Dothideales sp. JES 119]
MHLNSLPQEILTNILEQAALLESTECVTYTYGLSKAPLPLQEAKLTRYVRGPVSPDTLRWDSTASIRQVCSRWHEWALKYALQDLHLRRWRGAEGWVELSGRRQMYHLYELVDRLSDMATYRPPFGFLTQTATLFKNHPKITENIRRLWFNGFYVAETDRLIFSTLRSCRNLTSISIPWTLLRRGSAEDWTHLLGIADANDMPVTSLELQAFEPHRPSSTARPRVNFQHLKRFKIFGNTTFKPINDEDLAIIARTATNLEEFHISCLSTVSIEGVMAIVKASQSTIRVLEHAPRSENGFFHANPGTLQSGEHICEILTGCPRLKDLSISVPSMCIDLFSNDEVRWQGDCQVRALHLCDHSHSHTAKGADAKQRKLDNLRRLLNQARNLIAHRQRVRGQLAIELFFADCIFDPRDCVVHGDFALPQISSGGSWPATKTSSSKGPYGTTGLYGKDEGNWEIVSEDEYLRAVEKGWIRL